VPIIGLSTAWIALGESLSVLDLIGGALVFAGLLLNVFGPRLLARRAAEV
jgi:O-acetylserine/cysteine efflux transporter